MATRKSKLKKTDSKAETVSTVVRLVTSGVPTVYPDVTIFDTVLEHMNDGGHTEELTRLDDVYFVIESPDKVHKSKTNPRSVLLTRNDTTSSNGSKLVVPVKVVGDTEAIMTTAYYCEDNKFGELLWQKDDEK